MSQSIIDRIVVSIATGFGSGMSPKAPGTMGSLVGLPFGILIAASSLDLTQRILVLILMSAFGFWITHRAERIFQTHDDQRIVVDEIVGQCIAIGLFPLSWVNIIGGFLLFRLFDIWKPGPIGYVDERLPGAFGTFFDDVLAGIAAAAVLHFANRSL